MRGGEPEPLHRRQQRLQPDLSGVVATCAVIELEALFSARGPEDYKQRARTRRAIFDYVETEEPEFVLAREIQARLAQKSQHRSGRIPDMIMSTVAVRHDLTLLHYDSDFELIEAVEPRLKQEWVVPRGSAG